MSFLPRQAERLNLICRHMAQQAVKIWLLQSVCPECGHLFADGHKMGCKLEGVGGAELPEGWSPSSHS